MKELTATLILMTGDVLHTEYIKGEANTIREKNENNKSKHSIVSITYSDCYPSYMMIADPILITH